MPVKFTPTTSSTTLQNIPDDLTSKTVDEREHTTARTDGMPQLGDISELEEEPVILDTQEGVTPPPGESLPTGLWALETSCTDPIPTLRTGKAGPSILL